MSAERRQSPRYTVSVPATVTTAAGTTIMCELLDLSETGCRVRLAGDVQAGGRVSLLTESGEQVARVIWTDGDQAGLWFPNVAEEQPEQSLMRRMWQKLRGAAA